KSEAMAYLQEKRKDFSVLNNHATVKCLFFKFNTTIPSSAPVARVFSSGNQILTPRSNNLGDNNFEMLLILKNALNNTLNIFSVILFAKASKSICFLVSVSRYISKKSKTICI
ncbi:hypothetical protein, partial [Enterobacter cloacae complex sp. 2DZ2F20B]|uniref:hypothetical protein n=1 Tax=Enterobacter cloacae complex sp. 2DZ2F20B TaxID=2511993 RepID=UPI001CA4B359